MAVQYIDHPCFRRVIEAPNPIKQGIASTRLSNSSLKINQTFKFLLGQCQSVSGLSLFIIFRINRNCTNRNCMCITGKWRCWCTCTTPFDGFNSGNNFPRRKRLCHIIIGTKLKSDDLIGFVFLCRQNQVVRCNLFFTNLTGVIQSTQTRQQVIENNKIKRLATYFI